MADESILKNSPDISDLNRKARSGEISLEGFLDELKRRGVTDLRQVIWVAQAFRIGLGEAKLAYIRRQPGGIEAWEKQFDDLDLDALEKNQIMS